MWLYKNEELTDDRIPEKAFGFLYLITHLPTGRRYIGRKLLTLAKTRVKKGKKIRSRIDSGWRDYWSSSPDLIQMVEDEGKENFKREILVFAHTRGLLNYLEEKFLYEVGSMESDDWINRNIRAKIFKKNIMGKIDTEEISAILQQLK